MANCSVNGSEPPLYAQRMNLLEGKLEDLTKENKRLKTKIKWLMD